MHNNKLKAVATLLACSMYIIVAGCARESQSRHYGEVKKWNVPRHPYSAATSISVSPNGQLLAAASYGGRIDVYSLNSSSPINRIYKYEKRSRIAQVKFLDNETLLIAAGDGKLRAIDPRTGKVKYQIVGKGLCFVPFALSRNKKLIATVEGDNKIYLWSLPQRKLLKSFPGPVAGVQNIVFSPDGKSVYASTNSNNEVARWSLETGEKLWAQPAETYSLDLSPNGRYLAVRRDHAIELWDLQSNTVRKRLSPLEFGIGHYDMTFSPDGKLLAAAELGGDVVIWNVATGKELADVDGPFGDGLDILFSPDGKQIFVAGYRDSTVRMWPVPKADGLPDWLNKPQPAQAER